MDAHPDISRDLHIAYWTNRHLLNNRGMQAPMRLSTTTVHGLLFVEDCVVAKCTNRGLIIDGYNSVILHQPSPTENTMKH
ncbi:unnamed protein product [Schistocephalus solidus]|uniref:Late endosomal/lysosomal adaptor and MAPK and MTOR activator 5 n=1 Tax=Schistocephalus solidus TaxID=70667 RepID=A0A183TGL8_SCHSO|nr:unnamed protein product [Schistocephalus solidus]